MAICSASGALQPTLSANNANFNGAPTVNFAGSQIMKTGSWSVAQSQPITIFAVARFTSASGNKYLLDSINGGVQFAVLSASGPINLLAGTLRQPGYTPSTSPFAIVAVMNGASTKLYPSAKTPQTVPGTIGTNGFAGVTLGCYAGGGAFSASEIAEVAYFSGDVSSSASQMLAYAGAKYGIAIGA